MRPRVLHFVPAFLPGGAERMVVHLLGALDRDRFEIAAVSLYDEGFPELANILTAAQVPLWRLGKNRGFDPRTWFRVDGVVRRFKPDIVHTHQYVLKYVLPSAWVRRVPVLVHTVHSLAERESDLVGRWVMHVGFRCGVVPVAVAREVAASFERTYGFRGARMIPNGIPVARYRQPGKSRTEWRVAEGLAAEDVVFCCVANLTPPKNHALLIDAFARGPAKDHCARLLLVGAGPLRRSLEEAVSGHGLDGRVRFLGLRRDVPDVLAASDVFVLASLWEGNPLSVMEALSAGLPVVATRVGGIPELVDDRETGLLVPSGNAEALAEAMARVVADTSFRNALGRQAMERAYARFDAKVMAGRYEALYTELLGRTGISVSTVEFRRRGESPWADGRVRTPDRT